RLISLGLMGAFLYFATSMLALAEGKTMRFARLLDFSIRILLAVLVPILLVVLLFKPDGTRKELSVLSPEVLSFVCGYSAKLVIELLAKLVEKGSKMIAAI